MDEARFANGAEHDQERKHQGWLLQLYKMLHAAEPIPPRADPYTVLGYFDWMDVVPLTGIRDLTQHWVKNQSVAEQIVLMRPKEEPTWAPGRLFPPMAVLCFVILKNCGQSESLFTLASDVEDFLHDEIIRQRYMVEVNVFVTMDASPICIVISPNESTSLTDTDTRTFFEQVISIIECVRSCQAIDECCVSTYSFLCFSEKPDRFKSMPRWGDLGAYRVDRAAFRFRAAPAASMEVHPFIRDRIVKVLLDSDKSTRAGDLSTHLGSEDYEQVVLDVPFQSICKLYNEGALSECPEQKETPRLYAGVFDMVQLFVGMHNTQKSIEVGEHANVSAQMNRSKASIEVYPVETTHDSKKEQLTIAKSRPGTMGSDAELALAFVERHFNAYDRNRNNPFVEWVFPFYHSILKHYRTIIDENLVMQRITKPFSLDPLPLLQIFDNVQRDVLPASLYATHSVGYMGMQGCFYPRVLVAYTRMLNSIANEWDIGVREEYNAKHEDDDANERFIEPKHMFLLSINPNPKVFSEEHVHELPPDNGMVAIHLPQQWFAYHPEIILPLVLHEQGHYIGVRQRDNSDNSRNSLCREDYFIRLVSDRICFELYYQARAAIGISEIKGLNKKHESYKIFIGISEYILRIIKKVNADIKRIYGWKKQYYIQRYKDRRKMMNDDAEDELLRRLVHSFERGYFKLTAPVMKVAITEYLEICKDNYMNEVEEYIAQKQSKWPKETQDKFIEFLEHSWDYLKAQLNGRTLDLVVDECFGKLIEPAADMFMMRILDMSREQYLLLIFGQLVKPEDALLGLERVLQSETTQTRLSSVLCTYDPDASMRTDMEDPFVMAQLRFIAKHKWNGNEQLVRESFEKFEKILIEKQRLMTQLCNISDPMDSKRLVDISASYWGVYHYVQQIHMDRRYTDECLSERIKSLTTIREVYKNACKATYMDTLKDEQTQKEILSFPAVFGQLYKFLTPDA